MGVVAVRDAFGGKGRWELLRSSLMVIMAWVVVVRLLGRFATSGVDNRPLLGAGGLVLRRRCAQAFGERRWRPAVRTTVLPGTGTLDSNVHYTHVPRRPRGGPCSSTTSAPPHNDGTRTNNNNFHQQHSKRTHSHLDKTLTTTLVTLNARRWVIG